MRQKAGGRGWKVGRFQSAGYGDPECWETFCKGI